MRIKGGFLLVVFAVLAGLVTVVDTARAQHPPPATSGHPCQSPGPNEIIISSGRCRCDENLGFFYNRQSRRCERCPQPGRVRNEQCECRVPLVSDVTTGGCRPCEVGYMWSGGHCCYPGSTWNPTAGRCICDSTTPEFFRNTTGQIVCRGCVDGWQWSAGAGRCVCSEGRVVTSEGRCVCPGNSRQSPAGRGCECPSGFLWNESHSACLCGHASNAVTTVTGGVCQRPTNARAVNGVWECPGLMRSSSSSVDCACPSGTYWNSEVSTCECIAGASRRRDNSCVCPTGTVVSGRQCVCTRNLVMVNGNCQCPGNLVPAGDGQCVCPQYASRTTADYICECGPNAVLSSSRLECVCRSGFHRGSDSQGCLADLVGSPIQTVPPAPIANSPSTATPPDEPRQQR